MESLWQFLLFFSSDWRVALVGWTSWRFRIVGRGTPFLLSGVGEECSCVLGTEGQGSTRDLQNDCFGPGAVIKVVVSVFAVVFRHGVACRGVPWP